MKKLSAKIYHSDPDIYAGTAWLCSCDYVLTAAHCVGDREAGVLYPGPFRLVFSDGREAEAEVVDGNYDFELDAALLRITSGEVPEEDKPPCGRLPDFDPWPIGTDALGWEAYGFPAAKPSGMKVDGTIVTPDGDVDNSPAIQLNCTQGGLGSLQGTSGAAVLYQNRAIKRNLIVGLVRWAPPDLEQSVMYATPLNLIAEKFPEMENILNENFKAAVAQYAPDLLTPRIIRGEDATRGRRVSGRPIPSNLPEHQTSFVGRKEEVRDVTAALWGGPTRLLSLVGESGLGKTRIAHKVGEELLRWRAFKDGIFFTSLSGVHDPGKVAYEIANTLGVKESDDFSFVDSLKLFLRDKQMLLILDPFEHVLPASKFIPSLLDGCPELKILVTTRQLLQLPGEAAFHIEPMRLPADAARKLPFHRIKETAAVKLFRARAWEAGNNFNLTTENTGAIAEICDALGGLPLAIELIASQSGEATDFGEVLRHVRETAAGGLDEKLEAAIRFAYGRLVQNERALLKRLSIFVGGFGVEEAEAMCQAQDLAGEDIKAAIPSLRRKCLLLEEKSAGGRSRFRMLQKIQEFCLEQLKVSGEATAMRRSHAAFYLRLAKKAEVRMTGLTSAERAAWVERLERELDDIRAILKWSLDESVNKDLGLQLAGSLFWFWNLRGYFSEGYSWLSKALSDPRPPDRPEGISRGLYAAGGLSFLMGDYEQARPLLEESVRLWRQLGNKRRLGYSLIILGMVALNEGELDEARRHEEESVALFKEVDDKWGLALSLNDLGNVCSEGGDADLGLLCYKQSLALWSELEDKWGYSLTLSNMGQLAYWKGNSLTARELQVEALAIRRAEGYEWGVAESLRRLGTVCVAQNNYVQAARLYYDSLALHQRLGRKQLIAECLTDLAWVATKVGQPLRAALLYGVAEAIRSNIHVRLSPSKEADFRRQIGEARAAVEALLSMAEFEAAWAEGRALSIEQATNFATEYAIEWTEPTNTEAVKT